MVMKLCEDTDVLQFARHKNMDQGDKLLNLSIPSWEM